MANIIQETGGSNVFVSAFEPEIVVPLSEKQVQAINEIAGRLETDGFRWNKGLALLPYGLFRVGGREYRWYKEQLYVDRGESGGVRVSDTRLKLLSERMDGLNSNPHKLSSNDWSTILSALESDLMK